MVMALGWGSKGCGFNRWQEPPSKLGPQIATKNPTKIPFQMKVCL